MLKSKLESRDDLNPQETAEWIEALDQIVDEAGPDRAAYLLRKLRDRAVSFGASGIDRFTTPYFNTIPAEMEVPYPGDRAIERRIKSYIRWNAMAMVTRANKYDNGIGGHISTYASQATLTEVGFNHFFRGSHGDQPGDFIYFQGHASPGVYARAFMEGRLSEQQLNNFRHELRDTPGLSSYPHPWLMPDFWNFPTVSMGLGPINSIYHARFMRYLEDRGLIPKTPRKIWVFCGDGEMDEPESLGAISLASRERLDNLIFIINCNLQRLDGPVRGNGNIIQELEGVFRGAGWNTLKVVWGSDWDSILARDESGKMHERLEEMVDGEFQALTAKDGAAIRQELFGKYPETLQLVEHLSDEQLTRLRRGGHDPQKVFNAYKAAWETTGKPTVILAKTVKGYGLGEAGEGRNVTHQQKKLNEDEMMLFKRRFEVPISDDAVHTVSFYRPDENSPETKYMKARREALGGPLPKRKVNFTPLPIPDLSYFQEQMEGSGGREVSTTMAFVRVLSMLLKDEAISKYIVPIVPDEARTFGMESLFRQYGIYASTGQLYKPIDSAMFLYYREAKDGQVLQEGITEAGAMGSFTAAGTAYANYGIPMIPFFSYYSMFGFQRVGDQIWAFADARGRGFMMGGTAGRTTLSGEGLQHQDGHSNVAASTVPSCRTYDPAYAFEMAVIIQDGLKRMYELNQDRFYYITMYNENYAQPPIPEGEGIVEGILRGIYKFRSAAKGKAKINLFGSGPILNEALRAQEMLAERYKIEADVWSVTSYNELRRDCLAVERWNRLHPEAEARTPYLLKALDGVKTPIVAASDYMKVTVDQLAPWLPGRLETLGTDGFGRSENRQYLRRHFENNAEHIVYAALARLARDGKIDKAIPAKALAELGIDPEKPDPQYA
ncbi:MAG: pyruvate dehydrogenase (acetyl-transferring), homodimeric type [Bryobacterales bacterium]|nr:pyruvate dehydrogenase (acetyl-transferring), homodimeric type [Bryobacterales bacterium]